jgi:hypothetical protein
VAHVGTILSVRVAARANSTHTHTHTHTHTLTHTNLGHVIRTQLRKLVWKVASFVYLFISFNFLFFRLHRWGNAFGGGKFIYLFTSFVFFVFFVAQMGKRLWRWQIFGTTPRPDPRSDTSWATRSLLRL